MLRNRHTCYKEAPGSFLDGRTQMEPTIPDSAKPNGGLVHPAAVPSDVVPGEDDVPAADEYLRDSIKAEELYAQAVQEAKRDDDRQTVASFLRAAKYAETAREWYLAATALHAVGDIFQKAGPERNLEHACRMYRRAIAAYEECGHFDESRNLDFQVCATRLWHARELKLSLLVQVEMFLFWISAGFGYRPLRVLASSVVMVLGFGVIYWATGGVLSSDEDPITDFGSAAYFSGSTFLTINYRDLLPARHVRWLTVFEGLMGLTMSSFFVVVLANRLRH